jgi:hypothetical protein
MEKDLALRVSRSKEKECVNGNVFEEGVGLSSDGVRPKTCGRSYDAAPLPQLHPAKPASFQGTL